MPEAIERAKGAKTALLSLEVYPNRMRVVNYQTAAELDSQAKLRVPTTLTIELLIKKTEALE